MLGSARGLGGVDCGLAGVTAFGGGELKVGHAPGGGAFVCLAAGSAVRAGGAAFLEKMVWGIVMGARLFEFFAIQAAI